MKDKIPEEKVPFTVAQKIMALLISAVLILHILNLIYIGKMGFDIVSAFVIVCILACLWPILKGKTTDVSTRLGFALALALGLFIEMIFYASLSQGTILPRDYH